MTMAFEDLKSKGDEAFRKGSYSDAYRLYTSAEESSPRPSVNVLLNKSITALRMGESAASLRDARSAQLLLGGETRLGEEMKARQAKACYREGSALAALGRFGEAMEAYRKGLVAKPGEQGLRMALRSISHHMKVDWLAQHLAEVIRDAQAPNPFSTRDGKLLKPPIDKYCLHPKELQIKTRETLLGREQEFRTYVCEAWEAGRRHPTRCVLALTRSYCYLARARQGGQDEGAIQQSLRDAKAALAFAPQPPAKPPSSSEEGEGEGETKEAFSTAQAPSRTMVRARAHAVLSANLEHLGDYPTAAVEMARAVAIAPTTDEYGEDLDRIREKLGENHRRALTNGGADGLVELLEEERERALPEFMRKRPKYYYYYEWMKKRIGDQFPALPQPVVDKLLASDADELDLLLQYPEAIEGQVKEYVGVLEARGADALAAYETPRMSWEEVRALKAVAEEVDGRNRTDLLTNHTMVGAAGDGGLTDAERRGEAVKPGLDPEAERILGASSLAASSPPPVLERPTKTRAAGKGDDDEEEEEDLDGVD